MSKKFLAIISAICLMVALLPAAAWADDLDVAAANENVETTIPEAAVPQADAPVETAPQSDALPGDATPQPEETTDGADTQVTPPGQEGPNAGDETGEVTDPQEQTTCAEHTWVEETVEATCTTEGYIQKKCNVCGAVEQVETLPLVDHKYEQTGEENGVITYTCSVCGDTYTEQKQTVCEHKWVDEKVEATCTKEGYTQKKCSVCGAVEDYKTLPMVEHKYAKTNVANGVATYTCSVCGATKQEKVVCTNHSWTTYVAAPTCTEDGGYGRKCTKCGEIKFTQVVPAMGHNYVEKVTKLASTTQDGELTFTCSVCKDSYTQDIPRLAGPKEAAIVADPDAVAAKTSNSGDNDYTRFYSQKVQSYLYQRADGNFTRVEYTGSDVVVENYDQDFDLLTSQHIKMELPIFGGFFSGQAYNFLVFGQNNPNFSNNVEVIRVVKYDKNWQRLDQFSLKGANTSKPFDFGTLRMTEAGNELYIRTCHVMYQSSDGLCHQANMTLALRQNDMELTNSFYGVGSSRSSYVSHSFNQFVMIDNEGGLVMLDHGDGYPRAAIIIRYKNAAGKEHILNDLCETLNVQEFVGGTGGNDTGFTLGGIADSDSKYLIVGSIDGQTGNFSSLNTFNVVLYTVDKDDLTKSGLNKYQVTSYTSGDKLSAGNPQLVKINDDKFLLLWSERSNSAAKCVKYTFVDGDGNYGKIYTADARLSDCQPIVADGKVIWYYGSSALPKFCSIDFNGEFKVEKDLASEKETVVPDPVVPNPVVPNPIDPKPVDPTPVDPTPGTYVGDFRDVKTSAWYAEAVKWASEEKLMGGVSNGSFAPNNNASRAMIVTVMYRMADEPNATAVGFSDVSEGQWYAKAVNWAATKDVVNGVGENKFAPNSDITRQELAAILYRYAEQAGLDTEFDAAKARNVCSGFRDYNKVSGWAEDAILWANAKGLIAGNSDGTLNPGGKATRAEIATIMMRFANANQAEGGNK